MEEPTKITKQEKRRSGERGKQRVSLSSNDDTKHHLNDSEMHSYCEFINRKLNLNIDPDSDTELFQIFSEGEIPWFVNLNSFNSLINQQQDYPFRLSERNQ